MVCSRAQDRPRSTVRISSLRPATGCAFLPLRTASFVPRPTRASHTSAFRSSKDPSTPSRLTTLSCANSRRQCARRSTRAHSSTSLRKSFGAIPQDCPEVAKRKAPDPFMQFRGSETLDICYSHSMVIVLPPRHSSYTQFSVPPRAECRQVTPCRVSSALGTKAGTTLKTFFKLRALSFCFCPKGRGGTPLQAQYRRKRPF